MTSNSVRNSLMTSKLKEGVQDAIVYLRMLEGAKLPAVYERKRKQLMDQLLDLQGDTRKDAPPKFESDSDDDEEEDSGGSPVKRSSAGEVGKRDSKVLDRMSMFEKPAPSSSKGFQYKTLEQLKKEKRLSKPEEKKEEEPAAAKPAEEDKKEKKEELELSNKEEKKDSRSNTPTSGTPASTPETKKKGRAQALAGGLFNKVKKLKGDSKERSMSDTSAKDNVSLEEEKSAVSIELDEEDEGEASKTKPTEEDKPKEVEQPEPVEAKTVEEDKPLTSILERVTKRLGRFSYQKIEMTLLGESVKFWKTSQSKEKGTEISLVGAASAIRDSYQFELHTADKSYTFRTDKEELCTRWVTALGEAIDVCNPVEPIEEEPPEEETKVSGGDIPQINVCSSEETSPERAIPQGPNIRASVSYENFTPGGGLKKKKEMPDFSAAQVKGYMFKKGTFGKWERVWMGLGNDNVLYISTNETSKKVQGTVVITPDTKIEKKKGSERLPHALQVLTGKSKDTFATDSLKDFTMWVFCLEQATGPNDIQELLSEDEDDGELYEELNPDETPKVPASPRPPQSPRPAISYPSHPQPVPTDDDIYEGDLDGDIYEGLDEVEMPEESTVHKPATPILPPRNLNEPKVQPPTLPPRNAPIPVVQPPVLPPRPNTKENGSPQEYEAPKPSPSSNVKHLTPQMPIDDEVYDDVVTAEIIDEMEETYDDVEAVRPPPQQGKNLTKKISSEELYEDMTQEEQQKIQQQSIELIEEEEYSDMTLGENGEITEDFYDDVDTPPPPRPPPPQSSAPKKVTSPLVTKTITSAEVKPPPTATTKQKSIDSPSHKTTPPLKKAATLPSRPVSGGPKRLNTTGKVAQMSKMFGQSEDSQDSKKTAGSSKKGNHSGSLSYKSPGKSTFSNNHCVLENGILTFYSGPTDKLSHYRLSLRDAGLKVPPSDGQGTKNVFQILKGTNTHEFSTSSKEEFCGWMGVLVTAVQRVCPEKGGLYYAVTDHNGNSNGGVSFKNGAVIWVIQKDTPTEWTGIVGTSDTSFTSAVGTFPNTAVEAIVSEDVYI